LRIFMIKTFARFAKKQKITVAMLRAALADLAVGKGTADLGLELFKQRMAGKGKGKSGGYRALVAYRAEWRAVFLLGYAKADKDDIDPAERAALHIIAVDFLALSEDEADDKVAQGEWTEV
jgi:hypothetical protein